MPLLDVPPVMFNTKFAVREVDSRPPDMMQGATDEQEICSCVELFCVSTNVSVNPCQVVDPLPPAPLTVIQALPLDLHATTVV